MGSYSRNRDEIIFELEKLVDETDSGDTVLDYSISLARVEEYAMTTIEWKECSAVGYVINMKRYTSKYLINYYLPSVIFVVLSWASFFIPPDIVPGRMSLLVTLLLVLINQFGTVVDEQPPNQSPTAITIWFINCILFVACALVAYGILLDKKVRFRKSIRKNNQHNKTPVKNRIVPQVDKLAIAPTMDKLDQELEHLDSKLKIFFPTAFVISNCIYWTTVLILQ